MTEFSATPIDGKRPVGVSMLALMTLLVSMLALMLSFSLWLRMQISDTYAADIALMAGLFLFAQAYAVQAWALWTLRRWTRAYTWLLLILMTVAGLIEAGRNDVMALGTVLLFSLAFVTSMAVLLALHPVQMRDRFKN